MFTYSPPYRCHTPCLLTHLPHYVYTCLLFPQTQQKSPRQTPLQLYAALAKLRQDPAFQRGELLFATTTDNVLSYVRQLPGSDASRYLVVLNFGQKSSKDDYSGCPVNSARGVVVLGTCSVIDRVKGMEVALKELELAAGDGMVIKLL